MKKVILIEDRATRMEGKLKKRIDELSKYDFLTVVKGGKDFDEIKKHLKKNIDFLNKYDIIMIHRSALNDERIVFNQLTDNLKKNQKKLITFSGGISDISFNKNGNFEHLSINVNDFYGDNLFYFLDENAENLLCLAFGKQWELSEYLSTLDYLVLLTKISDKQDVSFTSIKEEINNPIIIEKFFSKFTQNSSSKVSYEDLFNIIQELNNKIYDLL